MSSGSSVRWKFVRHSESGATTWLWQRFGPDGRVEKTSEPHATYGKALMAALQSGFRPDQDDYSLDLPYGRMYFPPGRLPEFVSDRQGGPPFIPTISWKAWALLGFLHRADHGNPTTPPGPKETYSELHTWGLVEGTAITEKGEAALRDRYLGDDSTHLNAASSPPQPRPLPPGEGEA